jgi:hypothetical protein
MSSKSGSIHAYEKMNAIFVFSVFYLPVFSHKTRHWDLIWKDISLKTKLEKRLKNVLKTLKNWSFLIIFRN